MKYTLIIFFLPWLVLCQTEFEQMDILFENKAFNSAEVFISDYLKNNPENLEALELLGDTYGHQEKWDDAVEVYGKLVKADDANANYHYKYGGVLGMKALENKLKAIGFIGDIKSSFLRAAELDKNHIEARWALVELYMQLPAIVGGSVSKAMNFAEELEALSKVDGYLAKGYVYEYDDEPELAEKFYKKAIEEGNSLTCYDKLTAFYKNNDEPEKAIKNIEAANKAHNRNALHYQIGKVAAEYNVQLQKGEQCLQTYLKNYSAKDGVPKAWAFYRLSQINTHKKNKQAALKFINQAIFELPEVDTFQEQKEKVLSL